MADKIVMVDPDDWLELETLLDRAQDIVTNGQAFDQSTGDKPTDGGKPLEFNGITIIKKARVQ